MNASNINTFIEANELLQGDVVQIGQLVLGLSNAFLVFMGYDAYQKPWFAGKVNGQVYWISEGDMVRVFHGSAPQRIHRFQGTQDQRNAVIAKANSNLNDDTFGLMLNWATKPRPKQTSKSNGDNFGAVAGGLIVGAAVVALIAALFSKDE